ncbi:MAG: hypothetical protein QOJ64_3786 [Acidobacteriota bacterium]|jgi:hypothetical protein|nr:hypothetical protein [Acidobacteriota bacterium]
MNLKCPIAFGYTMIRRIAGESYNYRTELIDFLDTTRGRLLDSA